MATRTVTIIQDDLDGSDGAETIQFGLDGSTYEIDLSEKNAASLRDEVATWIAHARQVGGRTRRSFPTKSRVTTEVDNKAVRAWAEANRVTINGRGRIAADVIAQYRAAGN